LWIPWLVNLIGSEVGYSWGTTHRRAIPMGYWSIRTDLCDLK